MPFLTDDLIKLVTVDALRREKCTLMASIVSTYCSVAPEIILKHACELGYSNPAGFSIGSILVLWARIYAAGGSVDFEGGSVDISKMAPVGLLLMAIGAIYPEDKIKQS